MNVRKATAGDADDFARVLARVAEEGLLATEPPVDVVERADKMRKLLEGDALDAFWVLEDGGAVVGAIGVHETRAGGVLSLGMMVLPEFRGRGGGRALLKAAIDYARAARAHKLELEVWPDNGRAIGLYASSGFMVEGVRRAHYRRRGGELRSAVLMALRLDADP